MDPAAEGGKTLVGVDGGDVLRGRDSAGVVQEWMGGGFDLGVGGEGQAGEGPPETYEQFAQAGAGCRVGVVGDEAGGVELGPLQPGVGSKV